MILSSLSYASCKAPSPSHFIIYDEMGWWCIMKMMIIIIICLPCCFCVLPTTVGRLSHFGCNAPPAETTCNIYLVILLLKYRLWFIECDHITKIYHVSGWSPCHWLKCVLKNLILNHLVGCGLSIINAVYPHKGTYNKFNLHGIDYWWLLSIDSFRPELGLGQMKRWQFWSTWLRRQFNTWQAFFSKSA